MFTREFWRCVAIRVGVIYVQLAVVLYGTQLFVDDPDTRLTVLSTLGATLLAAAMVVTELAVDKRQDRRFSRALIPATALSGVFIFVGPVAPTGVAAVGVMVVLSALNPLLGEMTVPPKPVTEPGQEVIEQSGALANKALQEPQVRDAGLSEDEKAELRAEIEEEIENEAAEIARATASAHEQFQRAAAASRRLGRIVLMAMPVYRWVPPFGLSIVGLMLLVTALPIASVLTLVAAVVLPAAAIGLAVLPGEWAARTAPVTKVVVVTGAAAVSVAWFLPPGDDWLTLAWLFAGAAAFTYLLSRTRAFRTAREEEQLLVSNVAAEWPDYEDAQEALRSYDEWIRAMFEVAVLRIIGSKIGKYVTPSYATDLPPASVDKLGDIIELTQFVPTRTSDQLGRVLGSMPCAAIGLSGPRGVGKSTVLRVLSELRANEADRGLIVPAPTSYDAREFLTHLFSRLCELVLPDRSTPRSRLARRFRWPLAVIGTGVLTATVAYFWPALIGAGRWTRTNVQDVVVGLGLVLVVAGLFWLERRRRQRDESPIESLARQHLRTLKYLETQTVTRTGSGKLPFGDLGASRARQRAEILRSYPELVDDFRTFLEQVGLSLRSKDARVVICIDELDKIGSAEQAEKFLNDIKVIFRVRHSYFLVSVSEDAMTLFSRRALAMRTTFDTAFDSVVEVSRFSLADTRKLLVQQVIRLPEPFVWFCHCLSGGLPRDLGRVVRALYDLRDEQEITTLPELAKELVRQDVRTITQGQLPLASGRADAGDVIEWMAEAMDLPMTSADLSQHCDRTLDPGEDLALLVAQCRAHLHYAAAVLEVFSEQLDEAITWLRTGENPVELLAKARAQLPVDPRLARRAVDQFRTRRAAAQLAV